MPLYLLNVPAPLGYGSCGHLKLRYRAGMYADHTGETQWIVYRRSNRVLSIVNLAEWEGLQAHAPEEFSLVERIDPAPKAVPVVASDNAPVVAVRARPTFHHGHKAEALLCATARRGEMWMSTSAAHAVAWVPTEDIREFSPNYSLYVFAELKERGCLRRIRRMSGDREAYGLTADGVAAALACGVKPEELAAQYRKFAAASAA